jgi:hypothetical protein
MTAERKLSMFLSSLALTIVVATGVHRLAPAQGAPPPPYTQQSPEELQQLVAPIALYPDTLVGQILTAATFPEQVVEADRFIQGNPGLQGAALGDAVNRQSWDPSVKALTAFPAVLGNMDKNLSWTSSLGDAYYNQPQDVMAAVQVMRQRAQTAGNLMTTPQQVVSTQGPDITIMPANPDVIYVPAYDPWVVYGAPLIAWPGWYAYPGIWYAGPYLSFGVGLGVGLFAGYAWGWHNWGFDWGRRVIVHGGAPYFSRSTTFYNRGNFFRNQPGAFGGARPGFGGARPGEFGGGRPGPNPGLPSTDFGARGNVFNSPRVSPEPFHGSVPEARGFGGPGGESGMSSGAFSNQNRGGESRGFASRGGASFGGGAPHGGGGRR